MVHTIEKESQMKHTTKLPTVYSLYIKYMLTNENFRKLYRDITNKEVMKKAIQQWNDISDVQKKEWKAVCIENIHKVNMETLMQILFGNVALQSSNVSGYDIKGTCDENHYELQKETPIISSHHQMASILNSAKQRGTMK